MTIIYYIAITASVRSNAHSQHTQRCTQTHPLCVSRPVGHCRPAGSPSSGPNHTPFPPSHPAIRIQTPRSARALGISEYCYGLCSDRIMRFKSAHTISSTHVKVECGPRYAIAHWTYVMVIIMCTVKVGRQTDYASYLYLYIYHTLFD